MTKYIFVTGGVVSSLGKGLAASSIGCLLESRGMSVQMMKLDPYINVDPGTMSPFQHGEVFVTDDGAETDLDLGHYERFTHAKLTQANNWTSGRICCWFRRRCCRTCASPLSGSSRSAASVGVAWLGSMQHCRGREGAAQRGPGGPQGWFVVLCGG